MPGSPAPARPQNRLVVCSAFQLSVMPPVDLTSHRRLAAPRHIPNPDSYNKNECAFTVLAPVGMFRGTGIMAMT
jgi:hypothetical protein